MKGISIFVFYCCIVLNYDTIKVQAVRKQYGEGVPYSSEYKVPPYEWFDQLLDHFTPTDLRLWKQRYGTNETFYKEGGPVFLMIGGEGPISPLWLVSGQWIGLAQQFNALCFQLEHRFYGMSHPTPDTDVRNLRYLTSEQALADIAYFITAINQKYKLPQNIKWITFGGSYPGSLSAWARIKFPYLIYGAVSSSGPLFSLVDFYGYYETVKNALAAYSETCVKEIMSANRQLGFFLKNKGGRKYITERFKLCDSIEENTKNDISNLFQAIADGIAAVVQYNKDNRLSSTRNVTIDVICDMMEPDNKTHALDRYAALNTFLLEKLKEDCLDFKYSKMIDTMKAIDWDSPKNNESVRQWTYQTCTEFGFFQTSSKKTDLFGSNFDVNFYIQQCVDIFGADFNETLLSNAVRRTNILYGAKTVNPTNVIFVHGTVDPWHTLGILPPDDNRNYHAFLIKGAAHCADMYPSSPKDDSDLVNVRKNISSILSSWLSVKEVKRGE